MAAAAGVVLGGIAAAISERFRGPLLGWDVVALVYVAWTWAGAARLDAAETARLAVRVDPGRAVFDLLMLVAAIGSLGAVATVIAAASDSRSPRDKVFSAAFGAVSVVVSWALVHTVFASHYARLYYRGPDGGIDFHQSEPPRYLDFAYVAFTIGTTFQVSDTDITNTDIRATALRHLLLSYLLGAVIIAAAVNVLAGIAK